jgi:6-phosphogluconolactonase
VKTFINWILVITSTYTRKMKNKKIIVFRSVEEVADFAATKLSEDIKLKSEYPYYSIALTGGATPRKFYSIISQNRSVSINWENVRFFWGDERCVPPDSDESNYKMASHQLLGNIDVPDGNVFRINGEADPEMEAIRYSNILAANITPVNGWPRFDLVLLGMGEDGHVASIFPGNEDLFSSSKYCEVTEHPATSQLRVTITGPVINNAKKVVFLVTGSSKADIVAEVIRNENTLPASLVNPGNGELIWLIDKEAAGQLGGLSGIIYK